MKFLIGLVVGLVIAKVGVIAIATKLQMVIDYIVSLV